MTENVINPVTAYVGLGSNLDDPILQIKKAISTLHEHSGIEVRSQSDFFRNPALGDLQQPDFINAVVEIRTELPAEELLMCLQAIETRQGRSREIHWGPRTLDLDLLLYGDSEVQSELLNLPHPRMHERAFVLLPLSEINAGLSVPGKGRVGQLLASLNLESLARIENEDHG